jgi:hypothetical protein
MALGASSKLKAIGSSLMAWARFRHRDERWGHEGWGKAQCCELFSCELFSSEL